MKTGNILKFDFKQQQSSQKLCFSTSFQNLTNLNFKQFNLNFFKFKCDTPSHDVIHYLNDNKVKFVPIEYNPQNCPQARPIETLWSIIDDMVYDKGWEATTIDQLKRRITAKLKEIDLKVVQTMFSGIRKQLRKISDKGPYEACSF